MAQRAVLAIYNAFLVVAAPVLLLKKAIKFGRRGHHHEWDFARWNAPQSLKNDKFRIVLVALSFGEIEVLSQLCAPLQARFPDVEIVWSIRDRAAQKLAQTRFPQQMIVPMPFDFALATRNWLGAVRPDVLIVVEKFWWPNLVWGAKMRGAKVVLVNGRSRGREKTRYKWISGFQKWVLGAFDLLLFESESQIERVRAVLPRGAKVEATGNVKFAFSAAEAPPDAKSLELWLRCAQRPLLFAGSTSPIDDLWALDAFETVRQNQRCALVIAPRRIERAGEVAAQIEARGLRVSRRSEMGELNDWKRAQAPPVADSDEKAAPDAASQAVTGGASARFQSSNSDADVLLLDTLGELSFAYRFGIAAYVGGAVEGRGHNIIEPLSWGVAVAYGPNRGDFESAQRAAEAAQVGFRLHNSDELAAFWERSLSDAGFRAEVKTRAKTLLQAQRGALDTTLDALTAVLEAPR